MKRSAQPGYSCIILDDDATTAKLLENYIGGIDKLMLLGVYTDPVSAMSSFRETEIIDFLILDINMEVSGLDIARMLKKQVRYIIFITAYPEYALKAFVHGDAYLVKPVKFTTLLHAINELIRTNRRRNAKAVYR